jgi:RHS repeat-associated protein
MASITYPSGRIVTYAPDDLGRPTRVTPYATSVTHHPSGQVGSILFSNGVASTTTLNSRLWPTTFSAVKTASLINVTYGHDAAGNLTSVTDAIVASNNRTLGYDAIDRLTSASGSWGAGAIVYDGDGDITSQTRGSATISYTYDGTNNRLTGVSSTPVVNIASVVITPNSFPQGTYSITVQTSAPHNLQRHHVINVSGMNATGSYNLNGVRSVASIIDSTRFRVANNIGTKGPSGSYVSGGSLSRGYAFSYDAYGNVTNDGGRTFTYDDAPVLRCANCTYAPVTYSYDGRNTLFFSRTSPQVSSYRLYALNGDLLGEYGISGTPNVEYAYLYGQLVATYSPTGNTTTNYHVDPTGSPMAATDQAGVVLWREAYLPYGERLTNLATSASLLGFAGEFQERSTGLSDFGARHYDPFIGRYFAVDAVEFDGSGLLDFNRYGYANNNPYRFVDPDGNSAITKAIKFVIKGGDVAATFADAVQDVNTLLDPKATTWQRVWAGASLLSELAPVSVSDFKDVGRVLSVTRRGPSPNRGVSGPHGGQAHNQAIDQRISDLRKDSEVENIRKHQQQVDVNGNPVGKNLPDVQYDRCGVHHCVEYDSVPSRSRRHGEVIRRNDPNAKVELNEL